MKTETNKQRTYLWRYRETMECSGGRGAHPPSRVIRLQGAGVNHPTGWGREEAY